MAGFENDVVFSKNADFSQLDNQQPVEANGLVTNGQMWIGTTAANAGGTHINVGSITSPLGTLSVGYSSPNITLDLAGGSVGIDSIGVDASSGGGTNPVLPTVAGLVTNNGATVAAGTNPVRTVSTAANVYQTQVQISQAIAATDITKIGLAVFNSAQFSVDANGFVSASATGIATTITGDSGGALSPSSNNWNVFGLSGAKTSGSGATLTIKSPPFSQVGSSATSSLNTGEFVTAAVTRTLPASAGLADGDLIIFSCTTAGALVIQAVGTQKIRLGNQLSSAAGTLTSTAAGDSISLRFDATQGFWMAVSSIGNWTIA